MVQDVIASLISEGQLERYTDLTIKQFVDSSADIRWCPYPDCGYAICIRRQDLKYGGVVKEGGASSKVGGASKESGTVQEGEQGSEVEGAVGLAEEKELTPGENVECGQGHGFCWCV